MMSIMIIWIIVSADLVLRS